MVVADSKNCNFAMYTEPVAVLKSFASSCCGASYAISGD